jgi:hypothetical protein
MFEIWVFLSFVKVKLFVTMDYFKYEKLLIIMVVVNDWILNNHETDKQSYSRQLEYSPKHKCTYITISLNTTQRSKFCMCIFVGNF